MKLRLETCCLSLVLWGSLFLSAEAAPGAHGHDKKTKYGGTLVVLGDEEWHAEVKLDEKQNVVMVYLLDQGANQPLAIPASSILINLRENARPRQFHLLAVSLAVDPPEQSSRFAIQNAELVRLLHQENNNAHLRLSIKGRSYSGKLNFSGHQH